MISFSLISRKPRQVCRAFSLAGLLIAALIVAPGHANAQTDTPAETSAVEALQQGLLDILNNPTAGDGPVRSAALEKLVADTFDINAMGAVAVGVKTYQSWSAAQRGEFLAAFSRFMVATHSSRFIGTADQDFEIEGSEDAQRGRKIVHARYLRAGLAPYPIDYLVQSTPDGWRILDVYLDETISLLALHRSEFSSVLRDRGFDGFIAAMHAKADELAALPDTQ